MAARSIASELEDARLMVDGAVALASHLAQSPSVVEPEALFALDKYLHLVSARLDGLGETA